MIKQPLLFGLGGVAFVIAAMLFVWDGVFWLTAIETVGTVTAIEARDGRCGSRRVKHDCTKFTALVGFDVHGERFSTTTSAGEERGHGVPSALADRHVGEKVPVLYSPMDPKEASTNDVWAVWGLPAAVFVVSGVLLFASFFEGKKRSGWW